jgi:Family of unknown function (DUF5681)
MAKKNYDIGYKKPPQHTRWQKGQSGWPSGRRKKKKTKVPDVQAAAFAALNAPVAVNDNGKRRRLTALEVYFRQLVNKAVAGNAVPQRILLPVLLKLIEINRADELENAEAARQSTEDLQRELDAIFSSVTGDAKADSAAAAPSGDESDAPAPEEENVEKKRSAEEGEQD